MPLDRKRVRKLLKSFDFTPLFIEELGWDHYPGRPLNITIAERDFRLEGIAEKRGVGVFLYNGDLPNNDLRRKIEHQVTKRIREHLIIYAAPDRGLQIWQWARRESGKPITCREHRFQVEKSGERLLQKLAYLHVDFSEEEELSHVEVTSRTRRAFDVNKVTKRFYERFRKEHKAFLSFIEGIPVEKDREWYTSVMLNRLMFCYFIQKEGFLDGDPDYLRNRLKAMQEEHGTDHFYSFYRYFLLRLFHEGLDNKRKDPELEQLIGKVPYLNGGLFARHEIEEQHGAGINIPDQAFEKIFDFFEQYEWHLDDRPLRTDREINPDVLGHIFEKYINQKQMGAYYTQEDITEYIGKNTIIPFLFDEAKKRCRIAFEGEQSVWSLLQQDPDKYIYDAVRRGVIDHKGEVIPESALPEFVRKGMHDPKERMFHKEYNLGRANIPGPGGENLALPTETWREYVERRKRCLDLREKLRKGGIRSINDLITCNLDIRQFAEDVIQNCEGPELLRAFWRAIADKIPEKSGERFQQGITVLDPTCGSGAFLFAALNILEDLYDACLERMEGFLQDLENSGTKHRPEKFRDFRKTLADVKRHPDRRYYIYKSIILNNLYGVDIMEEAVEIAKLRLFLKLASLVDRDDRKPNMGLEPLPDIDFNICAGNTLVGFASLQEVEKAVNREMNGQGKLLFDNPMERIKENAHIADRAFKRFREMQTAHGMSSKEYTKAKENLRGRLKQLEDELNRYLAGEYEVDPEKKDAYEKWLKSHRPFHWFVDFYGIINHDGFVRSHQQAEGG